MRLRRLWDWCTVLLFWLVVFIICFFAFMWVSVSLDVHHIARWEEVNRRLVEMDRRLTR